MPDYKRQHYLPTAYLKYFSADQDRCSRDSLVWRVDKKTQRCVPILSQCFGDYLYSKESPVEAEKSFHRSEVKYTKCIDKIRSGIEPNAKNWGDLVLAMFDLHLRNGIHKNETGKEGIYAYNQRSHIFLSQILLMSNKAEITQSEIATHIESYWHVKIVQAPPKHQFVTSDHPSMWTTLRKTTADSRPSLDLITLPISPTHTAVAFDKRVLDVIGTQATVRDEGTLNVGQVSNAENCIYLSQQLQEESLERIRSHFAQKSDSECKTDENGWALILQHLPCENYFSFMRLKPPLL